MLNAKLFVDGKGRRMLKCGHGETASIVGELGQLVTKHVQVELEVVRARPGSAAISVNAAVFEMWSASGHVWLDATKVADALHLPGTLCGWRWWQKKQPAIQALIKKLSLDQWAYRPALPFGEKSDHKHPERCLTFSSISLSLMLVLALRCGSGKDRRQGGVQHEGGQQAFVAFFDGLIDRVPEDFLSLTFEFLCQRRTRPCCANGFGQAWVGAAHSCSCGQASFGVAALASGS